jgi:putative addiction module component (TIGR02574 family)
VKHKKFTVSKEKESELRRAMREPATVPASQVLGLKSRKRPTMDTHHKYTGMFREVRKLAMKLSPEERADLVGQLLVSDAGVTNKLFDDTLKVALELSPQEREEIATQLLESTGRKPFDEDEYDEEGVVDKDTYKKEWGAELDRRMEELVSGKVKGLTGEEAIARMDRLMASQAARRAVKRKGGAR